MEPNHQVHDYLAYYLDKAWRFNENDHSVWKGIWNSKLHERLKMFLWRLAVEALPTREKIGKFNPFMGTDCSICGQETETVEHLFFESRFAAALWFGCPFAIRRECWEGKSILYRVKFVIKPPSEAGFSKEGSFLFSLWGTIILDMLWRMRNEVAHGAVLYYKILGRF